MGQSPGPVIIEVDTTFGAAALPSGLNFGHPLFDIEMRGPPIIPGASAVILTIAGPIAEGPSIFRDLDVHWTGAAPYYESTSAANSIFVRFDGLSVLRQQGTAAFIRASATGAAIIAAGLTSTFIGNIAVGLFEAHDNASTVEFIANDGAFIGANVFAVSGTATSANMIILSESPSALINNTQTLLPGGVLGSSLTLVSLAANVKAADGAPVTGATTVQGQLDAYKRCLTSFSAQNTAQVDAPAATPTILATLPAINVNANESVRLTASAWWLNIGGVNVVQVFEWLEDGVVIFEFEGRDGGGVAPQQDSISYTFVRKPAAGNHTYALRTTSGAGETARFLFPPGTPSPAVNINAQRLLG